MRCLTLANALAKRGAGCTFVSRRLPGYLQRLLLASGHELLELDARRQAAGSGGDLPHSHWLGIPQADDADETASILRGRQWSWLVVDHYALDSRWERPLRRISEWLMVIDDLADREHDCDVLLDQTLAENGTDRYAGRVPAGCTLILGPGFALLRDEFEVLRDRVSERDGEPRRLLVFFGGADAAGYTLRAATALSRLGRTYEQVDVVVGEENEERAAIESLCRYHRFACHVQTERMAELMAVADVFIGAGGSTSWERCCMRLPAVIYAVAANQESASRILADHGAIVLARIAEFESDLDLGLRYLDIPENLREMSAKAGALVDGRGAQRVTDVLMRRD